MTEFSTPRYHSKEKIQPNHSLTKFIGKVAAVGGSGAVLAIGVMANHGPQPEEPAANAPRREYTAKAGDTEWSMGVRAYPEINPIEAAGYVDQLNPNPNHLVRPGQKFVFGADARIGRLVDPSAAPDRPSASPG